MEILREGRIPTTVYRGTCSTCGCIVECEQEEVVEYYWAGDYYDGVRCPTPGCKQVIEVRPRTHKPTP